MSGALCEELDERREPLIDRDGSLAVLGDGACAIKWNFQANTHTPSIMLDGDHTYWSQC